MNQPTEDERHLDQESIARATEQAKEGLGVNDEDEKPK